MSTCTFSFIPFIYNVQLIIIVAQVAARFGALAVFMAIPRRDCMTHSCKMENTAMAA